MTLTGTILLIAVGALAFGVRMDGNLLAVITGFTLSALAFFSLGYVLAGLAPSARAAQTIGLVIAYPMMFLSASSSSAPPCRPAYSAGSSHRHSSPRTRPTSRPTPSLVGPQATGPAKRSDVRHNN